MRSFPLGEERRKKFMPNEELIIFTKSYDFGLWLFKHTQKFPKSCRFSIAVKLETDMVETLEKILAANRRKNKLPLLLEIDEKLEGIRILTRFSKDMGILPFNSYEYAIKNLEEIGRLLGGWIKQQKLV